MSKPNCLVVYSNTDSKGRKDATGAFIPEAKAFAKWHEVPSENTFGLKCVGVKKDQRRQHFFDILNKGALNQNSKWDVIALFCHGWPKGIQFGIDKQHILELVERMVGCCSNQIRVILYACLAAENDVKDSDIKKIGPATDGGFADELRDAMVSYSLQGHVDAHKTAGHTTWNPYVVRFLCENVGEYDNVCKEYDGKGGAWLVEPRSQYWNKWIKALRNQRNGLRYRFPFMTELEIKSELVNS